MSKGIVNKIETFASLDGGGIRVAVFMQGCPLNCVYCHNPDARLFFSSIEEKPCPYVVTSPSKGKKNFSYTVHTPESLTSFLLRYKSYFRHGGVTFSGGEPLKQAEFLTETAVLLKKHNINIALDTSCCVLNDEVKTLISLCDVILADLKFPTAEDYEKYVGGNLDDVRRFLSYLVSVGKKFTLRTVVVPGINDNQKYISLYADFLKENKLLPFVEKYELLPFHTMAFSKYEDYGIPNRLSSRPAADKAEVEKLNFYLDSLLR